MAVRFYPLILRTEYGFEVENYSHDGFYFINCEWFSKNGDLKIQVSIEYLRYEDGTLELLKDFVEIGIRGSSGDGYEMILLPGIKSMKRIRMIMELLTT